MNVCPGKPCGKSRPRESNAKGTTPHAKPTSGKGRRQPGVVAPFRADRTHLVRLARRAFVCARLRIRTRRVIRQTSLCHHRGSDCRCSQSSITAWRCFSAIATSARSPKLPRASSRSNTMTNGYAAAFPSTIIACHCPTGFLFLNGSRSRGCSARSTTAARWMGRIVTRSHARREGPRPG